MNKPAVLLFGLIVGASCGSQPVAVDAGQPTPNPVVDAGMTSGTDASIAFDVRLVAPTQEVFTNGSVTVQFASTAPRLDVTVDDQPYLVLTAPFTLVLDTRTWPEGRHLVVAHAGELQSQPATLVVDRTPPRIVSQTPEAGSDGVFLAAPIRLAFSEPLSASTVTDNTVRLETTTRALRTVLTLSSDGQSADVTLTERPQLPFEVSVVLNGVTDRAGNALVAPRSTLRYGLFAKLPPLQLRGLGEVSMVIDERDVPHVFMRPAVDTRPDAGPTRGNEVFGYRAGSWQSEHEGIPASATFRSVTIERNLVPPRVMAAFSLSPTSLAMLMTSTDAGWADGGVTTVPADAVIGQILPYGRQGGCVQYTTPTTAGSFGFVSPSFSAPLANAQWLTDAASGCGSLMGVGNTTMGGREFLFARSTGPSWVVNRVAVPAGMQWWTPFSIDRPAVLALVVQPPALPRFQLTEYFGAYSFTPETPTEISRVEVPLPLGRTFLSAQVRTEGLEQDIYDHAAMVATDDQGEFAVWPYSFRTTPGSFRPSGPALTTVRHDSPLERVALVAFDDRVFPGPPFVQHTAFALYRSVSRPTATSFESREWLEVWVRNQ